MHPSLELFQFQLISVHFFFIFIFANNWVLKFQTYFFQFLKAITKVNCLQLEPLQKRTFEYFLVFKWEMPRTF